MSVDAMSWVFRHSPYAAEKRCVHLALADIANDSHDQRVFLNQAALAEKAHVSRGGLNRILATMIEDGYLEDTGERDGRTKSIKVYRLLWGEAVTERDKLKLSPSSTEAVTQGAEAVTLTTSIPIKRTQVTQVTQIGKQSKKRDELFESVATVCGIDWKRLTRSARGQLNTAVSEIRQAQGEPNEVPQRAWNFKKRYPTISLTPSALAKHWPSLGASATQAQERVSPAEMAVAEWRANRGH